MIQGKDHIAADIEYHRQLAACTHNQTLCNLMEIVVKGIPIFVQMTKNDFAKINSGPAPVRSQMPFHLEMPREQDMAMITHLNSNRKRILKAADRAKSQMESYNPLCFH